MSEMADTTGQQDIDVFALPFARCLSSYEHGA